jgi:hypothetical protein
MKKSRLKPEIITSSTTTPTTSTSISPPSSAIATTAGGTTSTSSPYNDIMMKLENATEGYPLAALTIFLTGYCLHPQEVKKTL